MNDTTRDELRERVKTYLADFQDTTGYDNHDMNALGDTYAQRIIDIVTAARDAEIREATMQPETIEAMAKANYEEQWQGMLAWEEEQGSPDVPKWIEEAENWTRIVLSHIGLHGDGTGGQG